jgi:hypothetical protein
MINFNKIWKEMNKQKEFYVLCVATPHETKVVSIDDDKDQITKSCDELNVKFAKNHKHFPGYYAFVRKANRDIYNTFPSAREIINALALDYVISKDLFKNQWKRINKQNKEQIAEDPFGAYMTGYSVDDIMDALRATGMTQAEIDKTINEVLSRAEKQGYIQDF